MATTSLCAESQVFQNVAPSWGVSQYNSNGIYGAAVSTADWNNDGWPDLTVGSSDGALRTFVNLEGSGFSMTPLPWVMQGETKALIWLDLDNDGDDDLFVQEDSGRCGVLRNDGVEGFVDVTSSANLPQETTEAGGVSFGDMDNDGDLDLHLCRYLEMPFFSPTADRNVLLRNNGDLTFTNVTEESGIDVHIRLSFQSIWWDENGDGLQDIFVINDKVVRAEDCGKCINAVSDFMAFHKGNADVEAMDSQFFQDLLCPDFPDFTFCQDDKEIDLWEKAAWTDNLFESFCQSIPDACSDKK